MFKFLRNLWIKWKNKSITIESKKEYHSTAGIYTEDELFNPKDERLEQDMKDLGEK